MFITYRHFFTNPIKKLSPDGGFTSIFRTIGFIGDSLSSGEHESWNEKDGNGYHDYYEYSWGQYIARKCGLKAINFSKGGMTAIDFLRFTQDKADPQSNNIFDEENKCQAYVIALGVNDICHFSEFYKDFGSMQDVDYENEDNNKNSFVGCYVRIIQKLRKIEPKCRIFVVSCPTEKPMTKEKRAGYLKIHNFLNELPKYFKFLYVIDLWKYAPYYDGKKMKTKCFCGGHMSAAGYKFTGDMVATYIDYYVRKNPKEFAQVGFIGKGDLHNAKEIW